MPPPPVTIYVTSLTSQPKVRKHIELLRRSLKGLEIPYEEFDLVMDEAAKTRWQRAKPPGQVIGLPGYLVGGEFIGTMEDFEDAVESATLETFLRQDQSEPAGSSSSAISGVGGVGSDELERLMRGMTEQDLDALMGELGVEKDASKVGLLVPEGSHPVDGGAPTTATTEEETADTPGRNEEVTTPPPILPHMAKAGTAPSPPGGEPAVHQHQPPATPKHVLNAEEKERVAQVMQNAGSVEDLMSAVERAEGKEKVD